MAILESSKPAITVHPGQTIGILGGGQLGRMMALEAKAMGYRIAVLDPQPDCPCAQVADTHIMASYTDVSAAEELGRQSDVVTYEFENVDADVTARLCQCSYVPQGASLLHTTQHRVREKRALQEAGVPIADYREVTTLQGLRQAVKELGLPAVLKTATGGYDGKGQWRLTAENDLGLLWKSIAAVQTIPRHNGAVSGTKEAPFILERLIPFERELSVMVARSPRGEMTVFPVAENIHVHHILHMSIVPARVDSEIARRAQEIAKQIAEALGVVGVLGVEMFLEPDGQIVVNELAPRPHNSGHYTQNACSTSQFEQHVRAICNLPLADVKLWSPVVMVNVLGQHLPSVQARLKHWPANWKLHLYGKAEARPNRKMGHVNVLCDELENGLEQIKYAEIW